MARDQKEVEIAEKPLKQYMITFNGEGGDVEVGHNFRMNLYKRNTPAPIDENYLNVVKDAVIMSMVKDDKGVERLIKTPLYSYSVEPV